MTDELSLSLAAPLASEPADCVIADAELPAGIAATVRRRMGNHWFASAMGLSVILHAAILSGAIYYFVQRDRAIGQGAGSGGGAAGVSAGAMADASTPMRLNDPKSELPFAAAPYFQSADDERDALANPGETLPPTAAEMTEADGEIAAAILLGPSAGSEWTPANVILRTPPVTFAAAVAGMGDASPTVAAPGPSALVMTIGDGGKGFASSGNGAAGGGDVDGAPAIFTPGPKYPERAAQHRWEGTVQLHIITDGKGNIVEVEILQSSGHDILDEAARSYARRVWHFPPGQLEYTKPVVFQFK